MNKGLLMVVSGPSGVGKGTLLKKIKEDPSLNLAYSISMTTRKPREGEQDGVDYYFVSRDQFEKAVEEGQMLEHAQFVGNCYGTPKKPVEKLLEDGRNVLLEIECDGAGQVMKAAPDCFSVFILPPSIEELQNRLEGRQSEDAATIAKRVEKAKGEMALAPQFGHQVVNDDRKRAEDELHALIYNAIEENGTLAAE